MPRNIYNYKDYFDELLSYVANVLLALLAFLVCFCGYAAITGLGFALISIGGFGWSFTGLVLIISVHTAVAIIGKEAYELYKRYKNK